MAALLDPVSIAVPALRGGEEPEGGDRRGDLTKWRNAAGEVGHLALLISCVMDINEGHNAALFEAAETCVIA